jgi:hypothetical protein
MDGVKGSDLQIDLIVSEKDDQRDSLWGLIKQASGIRNQS